MSFTGEFWHFLKKRKKYWLWPIFLILFFMAVILVIGSTTGLSAFFYPIF
ncbi:DUF5989 family protein [Paracrocinitomix mangrovi]